MSREHSSARPKEDVEMKSTLIASVPWLCLALATSYDIIGFGCAFLTGWIAWLAAFGAVCMCSDDPTIYCWDDEDSDVRFFKRFILNGILLTIFLLAIILCANTLAPAACGDAEKLERELLEKTRTLVTAPDRRSLLYFEGVVVDKPESLVKSSLKVVRVEANAKPMSPFIAFLDSATWPTFSPRPGQKVRICERHFRAVQHSWQAWNKTVFVSTVYFVEPLDK